MTLVYGCIAPHGGELIPQLAGREDLERFAETRRGLRLIANEMRSLGPETIIVATPHNLRLFGKIGVVTAENSSGILGDSTRRVRVKAKCDVKFAKKLLSLAEQRGLPVVGANYGTAAGPDSNMPMDWGTLVPLWFFLHDKRLPSRIVIVTPSREIPLHKNFEFGSLVAELTEKDRRKRYAFVASADQAHAHRRDSPYKFSRFAKAYDQRVVNAIKSNNLLPIMSFTRKFIEEAKPDSLWQMTMLAGAISMVEMSCRFYSYQVPTYYGMICAGFRRT